MLFSISQGDDKTTLFYLCFRFEILEKIMFIHMVSDHDDHLAGSDSMIIIINMIIMIIIVIIIRYMVLILIHCKASMGCELDSHLPHSEQEY